MRIVCAFCKTAYVARGKIGKCPVCGHSVRVPGNVNAKKPYVAAGLLLCAVVFAVAALRVFDVRQKSELLSVSVSDVRHTSAGYVVSGNIRNFSAQTYSVPDLKFVFKDSEGNVLQTVIELPPSGLIEPKSDVAFIKKIEPRIPGAHKISVQFTEGSQ